MLITSLILRFQYGLTVTLHFDQCLAELIRTMLKELSLLTGTGGLLGLCEKHPPASQHPPAASSRCCEEAKTREIEELKAELSVQRVWLSTMKR